MAAAAESAANYTGIGSAIQKELDIMMEIMEEHQHNIPEGVYLRGMNALGSLHRHKNNALAAAQVAAARPQRYRPGDILRCWMTLDEIKEENEELYDEIMSVADAIVVELCGEDSSIYTSEEFNLVHRGNEMEVFQMLVNYKPEEGNAGYETCPMILHHAIQTIMSRLFDDTHHELEIVRPVSCSCGWRGAKGNWERHKSNKRHQKWVSEEKERIFQAKLANAREHVVARRDIGVVFLRELHSTPETQIATHEAIVAAEAAGDKVIFTNTL